MSVGKVIIGAALAAILVLALAAFAWVNVPQAQAAAIGAGVSPRQFVTWKSRKVTP